MNNQKLEKNLINYDDIIKQCADHGISVTWRKLNYYKSLGLLPKSERIEGDKRGYYDSTVVNDLIIYNFLQNDLGFTLDEIQSLVQRFRFKSKPGMFSFWVEVTYGNFLQYALNKRKEQVEILGVMSMQKINNQYKVEFQKSGVSYWQKEPKTDRGKEIVAVAKDWIKGNIKG